MTAPAGGARWPPGLCALSSGTALVIEDGGGGVRCAPRCKYESADDDVDLDWRTRALPWGSAESSRGKGDGAESMIERD